MPSGWHQGSRMEAPVEALSRLSGLSLRAVVEYEADDKGISFFTEDPTGQRRRH